VANPLDAAWVALRGVRTSGPMAPEIALNRQRPAEFVFSRHVQEMLDRIHAEPPAAAKPQLRANEPTAPATQP